MMLLNLRGRPLVSRYRSDQGCSDVLKRKVAYIESVAVHLMKGQ